MAKHKKNKTQQKIDKPHDKLLFLALRNKAVARDAALACLPKELLADAELDKMTLLDTKHVSEQYREFRGDVIYEIPYKNNQKILALFYAEQQSIPEKRMPLRVWQLVLLILMDYFENHPDEPLPLVYPIVIYTGEANYHYSLDLFDLFGEQKELAKRYLLSPIELIDVCRMPDEEIKKHQLFGLAEFAFKYKYTQNFKHFLQTYLPWLHEVELHVESNYATIILTYIMNVFDKADASVFREETQRYLSKELGEQAMTIAEQLRQQGMQQGLQAGMQQEKYIIARSMLLDQMPLDVICKHTTLGVEEVKKLKADLEGTKH